MPWSLNNFKLQYLDVSCGHIVLDCVAKFPLLKVFFEFFKWQSLFYSSESFTVCGHDRHSDERSQAEISLETSRKKGKKVVKKENKENKMGKKWT